VSRDEYFFLKPLKIKSVLSVTVYRIIGGFLYAATSSLKRVLEGFSQLVRVFIEASQNFIFQFLQKDHNSKKFKKLSAHIQKVPVLI
jgi:hypothetical protein